MPRSQRGIFFGDRSFTRTAADDSVPIAAIRLRYGKMTSGGQHADTSRMPTLKSVDDAAQAAHGRDPRLNTNPRVSPDLKRPDDNVREAHSR